jgi:hypothetical protein
MKIRAGLKPGSFAIDAGNLDPNSHLPLFSRLRPVGSLPSLGLLLLFRGSREDCLQPFVSQSRGVSLVQNDTFRIAQQDARNAGNACRRA